MYVWGGVYLCRADCRAGTCLKRDDLCSPCSLHCLLGNVNPQYTAEGQSKPGMGPVGNQIVASVATSFLILVGVFYPSVTGESPHTALHTVETLTNPLSSSKRYFIELCCAALCRHHGWLKSLWRFEGPSEVHPLGHPCCHSNYNHDLYLRVNCICNSIMHQ